jgi:aminoglycoside phosphotransferase (APT) family kinase protein
LAKLRAWLSQCLSDDLTELTVRRMTETHGTSNEMYELSNRGERWVLRRPPAVGNAPSAHAVLRESRMLGALEATTVPHPRLIAACDDTSVIGSPFLVMHWVDGVSLRDRVPDELSDDVARYDLGLALVDGLIELERVDWRAAGLEGFGHPDGFLERQVPRWLSQLATYRSRDIPGLDKVAAWLESHRPPATAPAILHGDYGFFNAMFARALPVQLAAIVDWESATIGDPLLDLGFLTGAWTAVGEEPVIPGDITNLPGMATSGDLATRYARLTGRSIEHLTYYQTLGLFKLACIIEGAYFRYRSGTSDNPLHAEFETVVPALVRRAASLAGAT